MKNITRTLFLLTAFGAFGSVMAADSAQDAQDAYDSFQKTAVQIESELYAKQAELASLVAGGKEDSPRVQELFREMGELRGRLFAAGVELDKATDGSGDGFHPGPGRFYRGGPGFGCRYGGYSGRGWGGCGGGWGGHGGGWGRRHMFR